MKAMQRSGVAKSQRVAAAELSHGVGRQSERNENMSACGTPGIAPSGPGRVPLHFEHRRHDRSFSVIRVNPLLRKLSAFTVKMP